MTVIEFLEQVCDISVDKDELVDNLYMHGIYILDKITVTTRGGVVLIGEEDEH